ncbi:FAD:protein FMN transferase [Paenibacillus puldeungensis]|uniref:FAD:protein FMN transferase n=1 Tax=Paenibacillus puldeungensis TaxID=696536 RepID=A0ABW3RSJ1_9BACL
MRRTKLYMDTVVDIQVIPGSIASLEEVEAAMNRAFAAFQKVEQACSRFNPDSELMQAIQTIGTPVPISPELFEPLKFAWEVAKGTDGAFDPTVGRKLEMHGFSRDYLTGWEMDTRSADASATYRDVVLDARGRTLLLNKPLVIDLGAVAKGFAIDLAARELQCFSGFLINAGGDLYAGGLNETGEPWEIGIQHPGQPDEVVDILQLTNAAICTSGSYERPSERTPGIHHLIDPRTGVSPKEWLSCSVIAPFAMMADACSTTAYILGAARGIEFLKEMELQGMIITSNFEIKRIGGI